MNQNNDIFIIGAGLSGLISAILLNRYGFEVTVIEKKVFPFHRVCGEYVSNEVLPFLRSININVAELNPSAINRLAISSTSGKLLKTDLDLGGFGVSRYSLDHFIYERARAEGVNFILGKKANDVYFDGTKFQITLDDATQRSSALVIAAYGKRSNLDQKLKRSFFYKRSPYIGVKYHIKTDFPADLIQLDNFEGGYCGLTKIEEDKYCLCYLSETQKLKKHGTIEALEANVLAKNPYLKHRFKNSDFLFSKPEVINEISFESKSPIENHILFCGDAAGMITPLCGNGMAMAIQAGKILTESIIQYPNFADRDKLEQAYLKKWETLFSMRLKSGRYIQKTLQSRYISDAVLGIMQKSPSFSKFIIGLTHGKPFL